MPSFDPTELDAREQYRLVAGTVVPRPIALVTTIGPGGVNAAPFSFFNMLAVDPPMLVVSMAPGRSGEKDTIRNIRRQGEFVVHIVSQAMAERMNRCAASLAADRSEVEEVGFRTEPSDCVRPPRLIECPVQFECRVAHVLELGRRPHAAVIGEVVRMHVHDDVLLADGSIDGRRLDAIGRISGSGTYARLTDTFHLVQPD